MEIKPESSNEKILLALEKVGKSVSVKELAEITKLPYKNIHRNIKQLINGNFIHTTIQQIGRNRFKHIGLTSKGYSFKVNQPIEKAEMKTLKPDVHLGDNTHLIQEISKENAKFGIRFYSWLARELEIPNYSRTQLPMLKLKLGLELIKQSNLVISGKMMNKYLDEVK